VFHKILLNFLLKFKHKLKGFLLFPTWFFPFLLLAMHVASSELLAQDYHACSGVSICTLHRPSGRSNRCFGAYAVRQSPGTGKEKAF